VGGSAWETYAPLAHEADLRSTEAVGAVTLEGTGRSALTALRLRGRPAARSWWLVGSFVLVTAASLALRAAAPPLILAGNSFDEGLFVRGAHSLLAGDWLGPFDGPRTLSKGPGYPLFLAACSALRLPVLLAQQVLHLLAAASVSWLAYRLTHSRVLGLGLYSALALDPSYFGTAASRILRDNFYASIALLLLAVVARGLADRRPTQETLRPRLFVRSLAASALAGGLFGVYWLTREERPWLLPALAALLAARLWRLRPPRGAPPATVLSRRTGQRVAGAVMATGTAAALITGVTLQNRHTYGVTVTNDVTEGQFAQAFGQWQAVRSGPMPPHVPITRQMREAVYAVSPAAREIEAAMETGRGRRWIGGGCAAYRICTDVAGGWIQWALRASLASTGKYDTAVLTQQYWRRVATEIASACARRILTCRGKTPFLLPQPDTIHLDAWARSSRDAAGWLVGFHLGDLLAGTPEGTSGGRPDDWDLLVRTVPGMPPSPALERRREQSFAANDGVVGVVGDLYRLIGPPLLLLAGLGYVMAALRRRARWSLPSVLGLAAAVALVFRVELVALADATAFPAVKTSYLLPASSLLIVVAAIGLWLLVHACAPPRQGW
jgi:hypothetical protein